MTSVFVVDGLMFDQRVVLGALTGMVRVTTPNQLTCQRHKGVVLSKKAVACLSSASIWLPIVVLNARDRTKLSSHVARGTNLPFGKLSRDIGCRRSLSADNARKKAAS